MFPPLKEGEGVMRGATPAGEGPVRVPFRVTIPGLELSRLEIPEGTRYSFDDLKSLRLKQEHKHIMQGIKVEEESLRKIVEERETCEKSFLADRAGRIGEH